MRTDKGYRELVELHLRDWLSRPLNAITRRDVEARFNHLTAYHGWSQANATAAWPAGLAALASGAPLGSALLAQAVAGGRLAAGGAVKRRAPLELGDAVPQGRVLPLERGILPDERRGQAQQPLAPFPEGP